MDKDNIPLHLTPPELDFIANVLAQIPYGTVARANMLHLLGKLTQQAQSAQMPLPPAMTEEKGNGAEIRMPPL